MSASARARHVFRASVVLAASAMACSEGSNVEPRLDDPPPPDAGDAGHADAASDAGCPTCGLFPARCTRGALCAVGVSFEPTKVLMALGAYDGRVTAVGTRGAVLDLAAGQWASSSVGTYDTLRAISTRGHELWAANSLDAVFVRSIGGTSWTQLSARGGAYFSQAQPINGLFGDAQRPWAWAAITPVCAGGFAGDGVSLVRLRREPARIDVEVVLENDGLMSKCAGLNAIDGTSDEVWAAGDQGALYKVVDLESATPRVLPENSGTRETLLAVWAEASGHVWASGKNGAVVHRAPGQPFTVEGVPATGALHAVHGTSASDVWLVGAEATVLHFDGNEWSRVPVAGLGDRRPTLRAIAAIGPDRVLAAGDGILLALATDDERSP
ncbi:MAG: hypothetical protein KIS78_19940 [Labilithrix sp.]|nr:hypothetical protein [Labilithrix sp.]